MFKSTLDIGVMNHNLLREQKLAKQKCDQFGVWTNSMEEAKTLATALQEKHQNSLCNISSSIAVANANKCELFATIATQMVTYA